MLPTRVSCLCWECSMKSRPANVLGCLIQLSQPLEKCQLYQRSTAAGGSLKQLGPKNPPSWVLSRLSLTPKLSLKPARFRGVGCKIQRPATQFSYRSLGARHPAEGTLVAKRGSCMKPALGTITVALDVPRFGN